MIYWMFPRVITVLAILDMEVRPKNKCFPIILLFSTNMKNTIIMNINIKGNISEMCGQSVFSGRIYCQLLSPLLC